MNRINKENQNIILIDRYLPGHCQLNKFKEKIKSSPEQDKVVHREGSSGGGVINPYELAILLFVFLGISTAK